MVEATDRIEFDLAPGKVARLGAIDQRGHGIAQDLKHSLESGV